ncbi:MAG: N-acetylmuramoyl-L-alanine amidase [Spirochaetes bacterium]|nr:N-acetylmuramoyl-L-alanine amidase [Spirochaetota bacterium]
MRNSVVPVIIALALCLTGCDERKGRLKLLMGDDSLKQFFTIDKNSVAMFASQEDKNTGRVECRIYKDEYDVFIRMFRVLDDREIQEAYRTKGDARFTRDFIASVMSKDDPSFMYDARSVKPLEGLRVAIDPGHNAGSMEEAIREGKFMSLQSQDGRVIRFYEAALNLAMAKELREMLENDGATVMLTRERNRQVYPVPFDVWQRRDVRRAVEEKLNEGLVSEEKARLLLRGADERERYRFFNSEYEMPHRARMINAFHPHITVLAHFNAYDDNTGFRSKYLRIKNIAARAGSCDKRLKDIEEVIGSIPVVDRNFCCAYVPGCFLRGELDCIESRIEFLRLIISPDLENSARYSKYVVDNFRSYLDLPPARDSFPFSFHTGLCKAGVYARNFRMTRLVRGVLCLGEPVLQNNMEEALRLEEIAAGKVPARVRTAARAYYDAIREYVERHMAHLQMPL